MNNSEIKKLVLKLNKEGKKLVYVMECLMFCTMAI